MAHIHLTDSETGLENSWIQLWTKQPGQNSDYTSQTWVTVTNFASGSRQKATLHTGQRHKAKNAAPWKQLPRGSVFSSHLSVFPSVCQWVGLLSMTHSLKLPHHSSPPGSHYFQLVEEFLRHLFLSSWWDSLRTQRVTVACKLAHPPAVSNCADVQAISELLCGGFSKWA